jgi:hypothetical protein
VALAQPDDVIRLLKGIEVPLEGATLLAAAQQTDAYSEKLVANRIHPSRASDPELRLAAVLVGLGKAPEYLFELSHENRVVIGALNSHDDSLVAQYAIWAICENPLLGLGDLKVRLDDIEALPDRVRGYVYRLIVTEPGGAESHRDHLVLGARDASQKARQGLAGAMRNVYFEGAADFTVDWAGSEPSSEVKQALLDHMAAFADRCPIYRETVVAEYRAAPVGSIFRHRLEAVVAGTPLYGELRRIDLAGEASLFGDPDSIFGAKIMSQINVTGNVGAIATDNAKVESAIGVQSIQNNAQGAQEVLALLTALLSRSGATGEELSYGKELVAAAEKAPSKITLAKVVGWMKMIKEGAGYALTAGHEFHEIYEKLQAILPHLP